jgi:ribosomal protein S2
MSKISRLYIRLTIKQLLHFGIVFGHTMKLSRFLAGWFFYGWRKNVFFINLQKTFIFLKLGLKLAEETVKGCRPFWFVTMNEIYAPYIVRFGHICGEPFNVFEWIGGTLSNYRMILGWLSILLLILGKNKYKLRNMDKRNLLRLVGHLNKQLYFRFSVRRYNRLRGRHINRWGTSYNYRKFQREVKNYRKQLRTLIREKERKKNKDNLDKEFSIEKLNEMKQESLFSLTRNLFYRHVLKTRRILTKFRYGYVSHKKTRKGDRKPYIKRLYFQKTAYSRIFNLMNAFFYRTNVDRGENFSSLNTYLLKYFYRNLNKKNFHIYKHILKKNKIKLKNLYLKLKFIKKYNLKRKHKFNYLMLKQRKSDYYYSKIVSNIRHTMTNRMFKTKFLTILLLKGERRIMAKIRKIKKNSSFTRAFRLNRWLSPFDAATKTRKPGAGFVPTYLDNIRVIDEFAVSKTPFITLIDSNVVSSDVTIPIPSNDDSIKCINFFTYLITKAIFIGKYSFLNKWKDHVIKINKKRDITKKMVFFYNIKKEYKDEKKEKPKDRLNFDNKFKFFVDDLIEDNLEKFDVSNEIKFKIAQSFEVYYSLNNVDLDTIKENLRTSVFAI